ALLVLVSSTPPPPTPFPYTTPFRSREHVAPDAQRVGREVLHDALVEALVAPAQQRDRRLGGEFVDEAIVELTTAGRERDHAPLRSEEHTSELQSLRQLVCRLPLEKTTNASSAPATLSPPRDTYRGPSATRTTDASSIGAAARSARLPSTCTAPARISACARSRLGA